MVYSGLSTSGHGLRTDLGFLKSHVPMRQQFHEVFIEMEGHKSCWWLHLVIWFQQSGKSLLPASDAVGLHSQPFGWYGTRDLLSCGVDT